MKLNKILTIAIILVVVILLAVLFVSGTKRIAKANKVKGAFSVAELYNQANSLLEKGELLSAKSTYQRIITEHPDFKMISEVQKKLGELNTRIIFSSLAIPQSQIYEVRPGDSLDKIAKKFNTTVELLKKSNNISSNNIQAGRKLRVWTGKFSILVDKSQSILILKSNEEFIKTYRVSTGNNNSTPVGIFKIINKIPNPPWFKDGKAIPPESPENVLGTRWLGFDVPQYGIHGTIDPQTIGQQITQGCVRLLNKDVEELYSLVPVGTEVEIID